MADQEPEDIAHAVWRRFGAAARIENIVVPTLGGVNRTIIFDLVDGTARRRLVSRQETYASADSPFLPATLQFRAMRIAHAHGFPVPEPVFEYEPEDGAGQGYVTAFVAGESMPKRIQTDPALAEIRPRLAAQAGRLLALLHGIDLAEIAFLDVQPESADPIAAHYALYDRFGEPHPAVELGLRWLDRNRPEPGPRVLVHGDFRTGNFLVGGEGISAVLDWECAYLGDPAADLGWLCTRSWRFGAVDRPVGGFGHYRDLLDSYSAAGGRSITVERVRYWEMFGLVRWAILNMMQAHGHVARGRRAVTFAAMGRNTALVEYELMMSLTGRYE